MAQISGQTDNHDGTIGTIPQACWGTDIKFDADNIRESIIEIEKEIAPCKPRIIGVTKYYGLDSIIKGYQAGLRDFGESRAIEAISKIESLPEDIRQNSKFHFIGHLQTNKAEKVVKYFDYIHSVDSLKLAETISNAVTKTGKNVKILLQVNNANEEQKSGYSKKNLRIDLPKLLAITNLDIVGLMNMAPFGADESTLRELFSDVRSFRDELERDFNIRLSEISMGMSDDYKIAVEEGATMIRIGRKLYSN